ncbi:hypothetical protein IWX49DRAFT_582248 [Phyllosticta citricarpa]|uniref:Secreted peptide n=1 Tax=Phyllosticta citricarpa TaxID=55181 RepID=A0ABR1LH53_9PEZI
MAVVWLATAMAMVVLSALAGVSSSSGFLSRFLSPFSFPLFSFSDFFCLSGHLSLFIHLSLCFLGNGKIDALWAIYFLVLAASWRILGAERREMRSSHV